LHHFQSIALEVMQSMHGPRRTAAKEEKQDCGKNKQFYETVINS
jgi:hypothetical protein